MGQQFFLALRVSTRLQSNRHSARDPVFIFKSTTADPSGMKDDVFWNYGYLISSSSPFRLKLHEFLYF